MYETLERMLGEMIIVDERAQSVAAARLFDMKMEKLRTTLSPSQNELLETMLEAHVDLTGAIEHDYHLAGLRCGARLAVELLW